MNTIVLLKNQKVIVRVNQGNPWIFANELVELPDFQSGTVVKVMDKDKNIYSLGFYNRNSLIAIRLLFSLNYDYELIKNRILNAYQLRNKVIDNPNYCRIVYGESDFLPGLVIDRYGDYFSVEILSAGFELTKNWIWDAIKEIFPTTKGIIQRNSSIWRLREGLSTQDEIVFGEIPNRINIQENNINYQISLITGQKTGYFYDQRLNRAFLQQISRDSIVLDLFCNQGGFALNAACGGAKKVIGVDIQNDVIENSRDNAHLNNFGNVEFIKNDCFDFLKNNDTKFNIIISDPPAFTKSKKNVPEAIGAYYQINKLAIRNLVKGGILLTSSCSHHIFEDKFYQIIQKTARDSKRSLRLIYRGMQSPDHPILDTLPETKYLKFFGFIVD